MVLKGGVRTGTREGEGESKGEEGEDGCVWEEVKPSHVEGWLTCLQLFDLQCWLELWLYDEWRVLCLCSVHELREEDGEVGESLSVF